MKNISIGIFVLIILVFVSGCIGSETTFSGDGVSFNYPSNWTQKSASEVTSDTVAYVYDPKDDSTLFTVRLLTTENQKGLTMVAANLTSLAAMIDSFKTGNQESAQFISEKDVTINGLKGREFIYTFYGGQSKNKAVILEKTQGSVYYLLIAQSDSQNFDQLLPTFDKIINSFKVQ